MIFSNNQKGISKFLISCSFLFLLVSFTLIPGDTIKSGIEITAMDRNVLPSQDFYVFANGNWIKNNPIPASEASWGVFNELHDKNNVLIRKIIEDAALSKSVMGSVKQKVGDFYSIAMDTVSLEKAGMQPIKSELKKIEMLKNAEDIMANLAYNHSYGLEALFSFYVTQDLKQSEVYISYLSQGGIGLPDRDYYFNTDDESVRIRKEYQKHVGQMFKLAGFKEESSKYVEVVMNMETLLAKTSMTMVELRDDEKQYNKYTYEKLCKKYNHANWDIYFSKLGISNISNLVVSQPEFFTRVNDMLNTTSLSDWKIYLTWCLLNSSADKLNSTFEKQNFYFYGTILSGTKEMKPRWKRMVNTTNEALGEAVGQLYVEKYFSSESKRRVNEMVDNLLQAYKVRILELDWMSDTTKQRALIKLASFSRKLGYPDKWKDYSALNITKSSYYSNAKEANKFRFNYMISKLGKPIDKTEWGLSPQTINAYYNPQKNEIVFPAAIMQPPFYNPEVDDAVNYGSIGAVIGHEITHGFDDQGSKYDENGNLIDWWTAEDRKKFESRTKRLVEQFDNYQALDSLFVNGELTLGENIADLGGLTMAYNAYQRSMKGKQKVTLDGYTAEQRFFIGWAQVWRSQYRPESLRRLVLTDVHSPGSFRAIGAPANLDEFYTAFDIKQGDKMYRDEKYRVKIW